MNETSMHVYAGLGTVIVSALIAAPAIWLTMPGDKGPEVNLADMEAIEAELAIKNEEAPKQPQKPTSQPEPIIDEKVGGDPNAKAPTCKQDSDCPPGQLCLKSACVPDPKSKRTADVTPDWERYKRSTDESEPGDTKQPQVGAFDGSEFGWADANKGDKYFIDLVKDLRENWEYPSISSDEGSPVGCFRIEASGKILDTLFKDKSGNPELDDSVERAMNALKKSRNENPVEVPTHLLKAATTRWVCIRFKPKG